MTQTKQKSFHTHTRLAAFAMLICIMMLPGRAAEAQTYGGASSGDLLGYRSSSAHYYRRSAGSKSRATAARRRNRQRRATGRQLTQAAAGRPTSTNKGPATGGGTK